MRVEFEALRECASALYWRALTVLPHDVVALLQSSCAAEDDPQARSTLESMLQSSRMAARSRQPICQDTGFPVFLVEFGPCCQFACDPVEALSSGIAETTLSHSLRANCVDVLSRANTGNNRGEGYPIVHLVPGAESSRIRVTLLAKGSGSESRSRLAMIDPIKGLDGIKEFVLKTVAEGAAMSCPPVVVGVGMGGSFDSVALMSKKALARPLGCPNPRSEIAAIESELLAGVNSLGIGPMGLGGRTTALWVSVEASHTHMTCNPVSVNLSCWAHRRASGTIDPKGFKVNT